MPNYAKMLIFLQTVQTSSSGIIGGVAATQGRFKISKLKLWGLLADGLLLIVPTFLVCLWKRKDFKIR